MLIPFGKTEAVAWVKLQWYWYSRHHVENSMHMLTPISVG